MTISEVVTVIPTVTSKDNLDRGLLIKYLDVIEDNYVIIRTYLKRYEMSRFLYYACLFYDRFAIPTKYYIDFDDFKYFKKYFTLYKKIELEVNFYVNILSLELDLVLWELYDSLNHDNPIDIQNYRKRINLIHEKSLQLKTDDYIEKLKEYLGKKEKIESFLCGVEERQLKINVSFTIPIVPLKQKTIVNTKYLNKEIQISFRPNIYNNTFVDVSEGTFPVKQSKSNWQQGITYVSVEISGFVDLLIKDSSLFVEIDSDDDNHAHNLYRYLYYLLSETLWNLKINNLLCKSNWLIEPNDIESVTYEVVSCQNRIEWKYFPSKSPLIIEGLKDETQFLSIDLTKHTYWFQKCLILSKDYLSLGNSNLSIFWLNIGIESFFEQKLSEICSSNDIDESTYKEDYYQLAKAELQKINSKSIYKQIIWPKPLFKFSSVFKTLKKLSKGGFLNCSQKDLLSCYDAISKHRNKLFHGSIDSLIEVNDAKKAISSYEWIINNYILNKQ